MGKTIEMNVSEIDLAAIALGISDQMSILHPNLSNARQELDRCLCRAIDATQDGDETKLTLAIAVSGVGPTKLLEYKISVKTSREIDEGKGCIPNMIYKYDALGRLHAYEPQVRIEEIPEIEDQSTESAMPEDRECENCLHFDVDPKKDPCKTCSQNLSHWAPLITDGDPHG